MTRIDYYVLPGSAQGEVHRLACRIAAKAYGLGHTVYLNAGSAAEARALDDLLWTYSDATFVPHALADHLADEKATARTPVRVGHGGAPAAPAELLINLAAAWPAFFEQFDRVAEVIDADEQRRSKGRQRYRQYRDRGYEITTHKIGA